MIKSIVVPLDGSELAERALAPALALARDRQAELHLLRAALTRQIVVPAELDYGVVTLEQSPSVALETAEKYLADLHAANAAKEQPVHTWVLEGEAAGAIVDTAREVRAGLVIMSSHGYSGVRRWLLGSVAEKVLAAAPCPVWVVRSPSPVRQILITLDGSDLAEEVLSPALEVARCFRAAVTLLRVVPEAGEHDIEALDSVERGLGRRWSDEVNEDAGGYLTRVVDRFGAGDLKVITAVRFGPAADAILDYAERHPIDLVAMATHGRSGLRRWIYGSVTHKVLSQLPSSMLVARSARYDR